MVEDKEQTTPKELQVSEDRDMVCSNCKHYDYKSKKCKNKNSQKNNKEVEFNDYCGIFELGTDKKLIEYQKLNEISKVCTNLLLRKETRNSTEALVNFIKKEKKIYTIRDDDDVEMWIYHYGIFKPFAKSFIKQICRLVFGAGYTGHLANEVIGKIEAETYIEQEAFFKLRDPNRIAVRNGILDVKTKVLYPFTNKEIYFNKLPVEYKPNQDCPKIKKHLKEVLRNDEDLPVIQELVGYLLYRDYPIEKAIMLSGNGRNGKGKTLELMKRFLGMDNCCNIPLDSIQNDTFALSEFLNKMANLSGDISKIALKETGAFKNLTGRDMISANRKFKPRVHFTNYAKLIFCANELPITYDLSDAFWNRWVLLEFPYKFLSQKEIDTLKENKELNDYIKLAKTNQIENITSENELSGLLNWALEGLDRLLKQSDFSYSKSVEDVKMMWIRKSNSFKAFFMDCLEEEYDNNIKKQKLRKLYVDYCKKHKLPSVSDKMIKYSLSEMGISDERLYDGNSQVWYWCSIKFKDLEKETGTKCKFCGNKIEDENSEMCEKCYQKSIEEKV